MNKYLIVISFLMMVSCSNDNNLSEPEILTTVTTGNSNRSKSPDETDAMFAAYVRSAIYRETKELIHQFTTDLNGLAVPADADMVEWISKHIHYTNFRDNEEAKKKWMQVIDSQERELSEFAEIYKYINAAELVDSKFYIEKWITQPLKKDTNLNCEDKLKSCMDKATENYIRTVAYAITTKGLNGADKQVSYGKINLQIDTEKCIDDFNKCLK